MRESFSGSLVILESGMGGLTGRHPPATPDVRITYPAFSAPRRQGVGWAVFRSSCRLWADRPSCAPLTGVPRQARCRESGRTGITVKPVHRSRVTIHSRRFGPSRHWCRSANTISAYRHRAVYIRLLFVEPAVCLRLPSDFGSLRTPLPFS